MKHRKKSLSDTDLTSGDGSMYGDAGPRPARKLDKPAPSLPAIRAGYLTRLDEQANLDEVWAVLSGHSLYLYRRPDCTFCLDCISLSEFRINSLASFRAGHQRQNWGIEISHRHFETEILYVSNQEEWVDWACALEQAACHWTIEGLNLERGASIQFDPDEDRRRSRDSTWEHELLLFRKRQLLLEVLGQKEELENMQKTRLQELHELQAVRQTVMHQMLPGSVDVKLKQDNIFSPEQAMWDKTKLRQRKISMQIKADDLKKQLLPMKPDGQRRMKKGWFKRANEMTIRRKQASDDNAVMATVDEQGKKEFLEGQLQELTSQIDLINRDIEIVNNHAVLTSKSSLTNMNVDHTISPPVSDIESGRKSLKENKHPLQKRVRNLFSKHSTSQQSLKNCAEDKSDNVSSIRKTLLTAKYSDSCIQRQVATTFGSDKDISRSRTTSSLHSVTPRLARTKSDESLLNHSNASSWSSSSAGSSSFASTNLGLSHSHGGFIPRSSSPASSSAGFSDCSATGDQENPSSRCIMHISPVRGKPSEDRPSSTNSSQNSSIQISQKALNSISDFEQLLQDKLEWFV